MNVFDKLLGLDLVEDLTETAWWTDTVFRGLEQAASEAKDSVVEGGDPPDSQSAEWQ